MPKVHHSKGSAPHAKKAHKVAKRVVQTVKTFAPAKHDSGVPNFGGVVKAIAAGGGQNIQAVESLSDRSSEIVSRRNWLHIDTGNSPQSYTVTSTTFVSPAGIGWPSITACIGVSGCAWALWQLSSNNTNNAHTVDFGVCVDGATNAAWTGTPTPQPVQGWLQGNVWGPQGQLDPTITTYYCFGGTTGLTPGWHTFTLQVAQDANVPGAVTFSNPMLAVWPL